jgi:hypothetical protein
MLTIVDRGVDVLVGTGRIGGDLAAALKKAAASTVAVCWNWPRPFRFPVGWFHLTLNPPP